MKKTKTATQPVLGGSKMSKACNYILKLTIWRGKTMKMEFSKYLLLFTFGISAACSSSVDEKNQVEEHFIGDSTTVTNDVAESIQATTPVGAVENVEPVVVSPISKKRGVIVFLGDYLNDVDFSKRSRLQDRTLDHIRIIINGVELFRFDAKEIIKNKISLPKVVVDGVLDTHQENSFLIEFYNPVGERFAKRERPFWYTLGNALVDSEIFIDVSLQREDSEFEGLGNELLIYEDDPTHFKLKVFTSGNPIGEIEFEALSPYLDVVKESITFDDEGIFSLDLKLNLDELSEIDDLKFLTSEVAVNDDVESFRTIITIPIKPADIYLTNLVSLDVDEIREANGGLVSFDLVFTNWPSSTVFPETLHIKDGSVNLNKNLIGHNLELTNFEEINQNKFVLTVAVAVTEGMPDAKNLLIMLDGSSGYRFHRFFFKSTDRKNDDPEGDTDENEEDQEKNSGEIFIENDRSTDDKNMYFKRFMNSEEFQDYQINSHGQIISVDSDGESIVETHLSIFYQETDFSQWYELNRPLTFIHDASGSVEFFIGKYTHGDGKYLIQALTLVDGVLVKRGTSNLTIAASEKEKKWSEYKKVTRTYIDVSRPDKRSSDLLEPQRTFYNELGQLIEFKLGEVVSANFLIVKDADGKTHVYSVYSPNLVNILDFSVQGRTREGEADTLEVLVVHERNVNNLLKSPLKGIGINITFELNVKSVATGTILSTQSKNLVLGDIGQPCIFKLNKNYNQPIEYSVIPRIAGYGELSADSIYFNFSEAD